MAKSGVNLDYLLNFQDIWFRLCYNREKMNFFSDGKARGDCRACKRFVYTYKAEERNGFSKWKDEKMVASL